MNRYPATPLGWIWIASKLALLLYGLMCPSLLEAASSRLSAWTTNGAVRSMPLQPTSLVGSGFTLMSPEQTSIWFTNQLSMDRSLTNHILMNGSGVACGDVNRDGWVDIYLCNIDGDNALFLNQSDLRFTNITTLAGVGCTGLDCTGAVFADADGDQDLDLFVATVGPGVRYFVNDGSGRFADRTQDAGLASPGGTMSVALADADRDGDLDVYVVNYRTTTIRDQFNLRLKVSGTGTRKVVTSVNGRSATEPDLVGRFTLLPDGGFMENGEADVFYLNDGKGRFEQISFLSGRFRNEQDQPLTEIPYDWGLSALFRDLNGDGLPDLYVCNDLLSPDRIWLNRGDGSFRAAGGLAIRQTSWFSMGADAADINRDGWDDLFVADMLSRDHYKRQTQDNSQRFSPRTFGRTDERLQTARNTLLLGRGNSEWSEMAWLSGLAATDWSWSPVFLDVDLDGYEDVLVTTGFERDVQDLDTARELEAMRSQTKMSDRDSLLARRRFPPLLQPNLAFRNQGDLTFKDSSRQWGFDLVGVSQGIALADLDNDGDLDVVINNMTASASVLRNNASAARIAVRLMGDGMNSSGAGARIKLIADRFSQQQEVTLGGRYLSSDDGQRTFAADPSLGVRALEVRWASGRTTTFSNPDPNTLYWVSETTSATTLAVPARLQAVPGALFTNLSWQLAHTHSELPFDDFSKQPLLPRRLSHLGPGVTWFDLDGDSMEDLILGAGRGGKITIYRNTGPGVLTRVESTGFQALEDDTTTLLGLDLGGHQSGLLLGVGNVESGQSQRAAAAVARISLKEGRCSVGEPELLSAAVESSGAMVLADIDLDGRLDLFVGGRVIAGRYPESASSRIYRGSTNGFQLDANNTRQLEKIGLVTAAVFADLTGDGSPDLVIATEWGPIRVLINTRGQLEEATAAWGTQGTIGWWNSVASADFNGDGHLDIVAGNWGRNHSGNEHGSLLLHGDLDVNGTYDIVEAYREPGTGRLLPKLTFDRLGEHLPFLRARFDSYGGYAKATLEQILGAEIAQAKTLEVQEFETSVYLNLNQRFQKQRLPVEAQWAPVFGITVSDLDGDGLSDLFLAQNFFGTEPRSDRLNGGSGQVLLGTENGGFRPLAPEISGVRLYGEQRGAAACDFDGDGRVDLVVAQNGEATQLLRNQGALPGLRVHLRMTAPDRWAVGAVARAVYTTGALGPAWEVRSGGGYWSQDSPILVLGQRTNIASLWVRWPGGSVTTVKVPPQARDIEVNSLGVVKVLR